MTSRSLSLCAGSAIFFLAAVGHAQQLQFQQPQLGPVSGGYVTQGAPVVSPENGLLLSDSALLHMGGTVELGYDTNVFYDQYAPAHSAFLRVTPFLELTNTGRNGVMPSGLFYDLRASLAYREYLSSDAYIQNLRSFSPSFSAGIEHNSNGTVVLSFSDAFARIDDPPYTRFEAAEKQLITRDNNLAVGQLRWSPGGGRLQGILRLTNTFDWFEYKPLKPASSMTNDLMLDASWRWFPKTALFLQVRQGYTFYFDDNSGNASADEAALVTTGKKSSSFPLRAVLGIRGLITEKTSISLAAGYQNAFYSQGTSTFGFLGSTLLAAELVVMPILPAKITLGVHHDFQNSVLGNFYYDDGAYVALSYTTLARLIGSLWGRYDHKRFYDVPGIAGGERIDDFVQAGAVLDYYLRSWIYAGVSYTLGLNNSNADGLNLTGTTYTKHQVYGRIGITY
jgi:hypothetical protein